MSKSLALFLYFIGCLLSGIAGGMKFYFDEKKRIKEKHWQEKNNS